MRNNNRKNRGQKSCDTVPSSATKMAARKPCHLRLTCVCIVYACFFIQRNLQNLDVQHQLNGKVIIAPFGVRKLYNQIIAE